MITIITGGTGSIKLLRGLDSIVNENMNIIVNVGDNINLFGYYICPDIDTTIYGLSNRLDVERGWGIKGDTFNFLESIKEDSKESWFQIGDKDLETHVKRTNLKNNGLNLSEITKRLSEDFKIRHRIMPASNDKIETTIISNDDEMHLQEFWVKNKGKLDISDVKYKGIDNAKPAEGVIKSIKEADKIIITPGNPISSIGPTIFIKEIKKALQKSQSKKILVSPIIHKKPVSGPAGKMFTAKGYDISVTGLTKYYKDFITDIVIDNADIDEKKEIEKMQKITHVRNILMRNKQEEVRLAKEVMNITK
ncbi:MAG: 2-phospho-L-lactate transferase [Thaumarchaeota archaeon]|nr:2-phospho-L-lactate transferase [Nitrososphaerota archaeon]|tara:strand:- start:2225 stop:3145 length:921 start_codon:yes stop_codon:yes gene_type:complete